MPPFQLPAGRITRDAYKAIGDPEAARMAAERKIERQLRAGLNEWVQKVLPNITEANAYNIAQQLRDGDIYFRDVLQDALSYSADLGTNIAIDKLGDVGMGFDYTLANTNASKWATEYTNQLMVDLNVTNDKIVGESVSKWMENSKPIQSLRDDIAQRVSGAYGRNRSQRSELIARTEVTRAVAEGERIAYKESGVVSGMRWLTKNDELVCPYCGSLHMQVVSLDGGAFYDALPDDLQRKLGNRTFEVPPAHPGCRCTISPVVIDVEAGSGAIDYDILVPDQFAADGEIRERFTGRDAALADKEAGKWAENLTESEREAMARWSGNGFVDARKNIAAGNLTAEDKLFLDSLSSAPKVNGIVYRGVKPQWGMNADDFYSQMERSVGTVMKWDAPTSSSLSPDIGARFGEFVFEVKSKNARYINPISIRGDEMEAVFMPNSKFKILGISKQTYRVENSEFIRNVIQITEL